MAKAYFWKPRQSQRQIFAQALGHFRRQRAISSQNLGSFEHTEPKIENFLSIALQIPKQKNNAFFYGCSYILFEQKEVILWICDGLMMF